MTNVCVPLFVVLQQYLLLFEAVLLLNVFLCSMSGCTIGVPVSALPRVVSEILSL